MFHSLNLTMSCSRSSQKILNILGKATPKKEMLEFDFEYCLACELRLLNGKPIMIKDILEDEFERFVIQAKNNNYIGSEQTTLQHTDFETLERLIKNALEFGKLRESNSLIKKL